MKKNNAGRPKGTKAARTIPMVDFKEIYLKYKGVADNILEHIKQNHEPNVKRTSILKRIRYGKEHGILPIESGNYVGSGETLKGVSTLYDNEGNIKIQWVKTNVEKEDQLRAFEQAVDNIVSNIKPIDPRPEPKNVDSDILVKIPIADAHIGLLTWHKEVKQDFDLKIAKDLFSSAMDRLIDSSPSAETCLLLDLGGLSPSNVEIR